MLCFWRRDVTSERQDRLFEPQDGPMSALKPPTDPAHGAPRPNFSVIEGGTLFYPSRFVLLILLQLLQQILQRYTFVLLLFLDTVWERLRWLHILLKLLFDDVV